MNNASFVWYDPILEETPDHLAGSDSWAGHIPFAFYLIAALRPAHLAELGVFAGNSLFAFAQAARKLEHPIRISGVDAWESDPHSGGYDGATVYQWVQAQQARYPEMVTLYKSFFDQARPNFSAGSLDVLHIDGYHHYDAVSHDFHTWREALKSNGVVLFHDISVRRDDFGVWRFWDEIKAEYGAEQTLEFLHSNGLGVLLLAKPVHYPQKLQGLFEAYRVAPDMVQTLFRLAGARIQERFAALDSQREAREDIARLTQDAVNWQQECQRLNAQIQTIHQSRSWKLTAPLRITRRKLGA